HRVTSYTFVYFAGPLAAPADPFGFAGFLGAGSGRVVAACARLLDTDVVPRLSACVGVGVLDSNDRFGARRHLRRELLDHAFATLIRARNRLAIDEQLGGEIDLRGCIDGNVDRARGRGRGDREAVDVARAPCRVDDRALGRNLERFVDEIVRLELFV